MAIAGATALAACGKEPEPQQPPPHELAPPPPPAPNDQQGVSPAVYGAPPVYGPKDRVPVPTLKPDAGK